MYVNSNLVGYNYLTECIELTDNHNIITIISSGIHDRNGFICFAGMCLAPRFSLAAQDSKQVLDSWKWFVNQLGEDGGYFEYSVEGAAIAMYLDGSSLVSTPYRVIGLIVELFRLDSLGVDVKPKIRHIMSQVKGHLRKSKRMTEHPDKLGTMTYLLTFLNSIVAETLIALVAKQLGHDVKLGESPDVVIDNIAVEIKSPETNVESAIENIVEKGFDKANLVVINSLQIPENWLKNKATIMGEVDISMALTQALSLAKNNRRCLLFYGNRISREYKVAYFGRVVILK